MILRPLPQLSEDLRIAPQVVVEAVSGFSPAPDLVEDQGGGYGAAGAGLCGTDF